MPRWLSDPPNTQFTLNRQSPLARGLVGWWPALGGRGGLQWRDYAGHRHAVFPGGTANPVVRPDGQQGMALDLDGSDDYLTIPGGFGLISGNNFHSVALWINGDSFANSPLLLECSNSGNDNFFLEANDNGTGIYWGYRISTSTDFRTYTGLSFATGWHHIACVKTGTGNSGNLYVDGKLATTFSGTLASVPTATVDMWVGRYSSGLNFDGAITDLTIHDRPLSEAEVRRMCNPATRWELYAPVPRFRPVPFVPSEEPGASLVHPVVSAAGIHSAIFGRQIVR